MVIRIFWLYFIRKFVNEFSDTTDFQQINPISYLFKVHSAVYDWKRVCGQITIRKHITPTDISVIMIFITPTWDSHTQDLEPTE